MNESARISEIYSACSSVLDNWVFKLVFLLGVIFVGILIISKCAHLMKDCETFVCYLFDEDGKQYSLFKDGHVEAVSVDSVL